MVFLSLIGLAMLTAIIAPLIIVAFGGRFSYLLAVVIAILTLSVNVVFGDKVWSHSDGDAASTILVMAFWDFVGLLCFGALVWAIKKDSR